jgi:hypothetical protein
VIGKKTLTVLFAKRQKRRPVWVKEVVLNIKRLVWTAVVAGLAPVLSVQGFASQAVPVQNQIPQQVIINGQRVNGAYVSAASGGLQTFTCAAPQQYTTPDGASHGWACYDAATGVWFLNALPPSTSSVQQVPQAPVYQQPPTIVYQTPPTVIYQQPIPATVVYTTPAPVIVAPVYPSGVVLGVAAINATGRIVSAAIRGSRYPYVYYGRPGHRRW